MNYYFLFFGVVIVLMLFAARKESGKRVDIENVDHGHIVHWQTHNTTMLRSKSVDAPKPGTLSNKKSQRTNVIFFHDKYMKWQEEAMRHIHINDPDVQIVYITTDKNTHTYEDYVKTVYTSKLDADINTILNRWGDSAILTTSMMRFYYIESYLRLNGIENVFHVESDNSIRGKFSDILPIILRKKWPLAATQLCVGQMTASVMYIRKHSDMRDMIDEAEKWFTLPHEKVFIYDKTKKYPGWASSEMSFLGYYHYNFPEKMFSLPILPFGKYSDLDFPYLFDPATYHQWSRGLKRETHHIVQQALSSGQVKLDKSKWFVSFKGRQFPLFNVHVDNKKLHEKKYLIPASTQSEDISNEASADVQNKVVNVSNILWSRNWHNLVTCSTVPESYYNAATEKRHSAQEMMKYFSGCGGPLWVRLNTDHRNAKNNDITTFATHVLPKMKKTFVLITTDGDNSVPSNIDKAQDILDSPLCKAWYTQNYDGSLKHSKLKPIPIGFDLHTNWKGLWTDNVSENLEKMLELRANSLERTRDAVPFVPPWGASHHERIRSDNALECLHHVHGNRMGIDKLWDTYGSKTFALSPQGNGLDCHRTWELLFFGVIPIVKSVGGLDAMYKDLPVVIVKDWTDVCAPKFFVNERERLKDKWPMSLDKFQLDYWVRLVVMYSVRRS